MTKFLVMYSYNGNGKVYIEAEDEEQAEQKFYEGEFSNEIEGGENYEVDKVIAPETVQPA